MDASDPPMMPVTVLAGALGTSSMVAAVYRPRADGRLWAAGTMSGWLRSSGTGAARCRLLDTIRGGPAATSSSQGRGRLCVGGPAR